MTQPGIPVERAVKRLIDIVVAAVLLVVLGPLLVMIGLLVKLTSRGPVLFVQQRVGQAERTFDLYKFRSMRTSNCDAEHRAFVTAQLRGESEGQSSDGTFKLDDPRVTDFGRFLRRYSLDELPQLFNVLNGSMSLVGPRPSLSWEIELFADHHRLRAAAVPGCSGLWQVSGRNRLSNREMLDLDIDYVTNWSLGRDISILLKTPFAIVRGDGAK